MKGYRPIENSEMRAPSTLRIAHFSPLPPQRSGIATYCAELLPHLATHMQVDAYVEVVTPEQPQLLLVTVRPLSEFVGSPQLRSSYDMCLYHMGNHPKYHEQIYATLLHFPGVTVLHETDLNAFHLNRAGFASYVREMGYACGRQGVRDAYRAVDGQREPQMGAQLYRRVVDVGLGVIVHTQYAQRHILAESPRARIAHIPLAVSPIADPPATGRPLLVEQFSPGTIVLASFGYIAPSKRIETVLHAVARLREKLPNLIYLLVGEVVPGYELKPLIYRLGLNEIVHLIGFVSGAEFQAYLNTVDIGINLRSAPTGGEMSATLVRLMASGRPVVVSNVGEFAAMPDDCVIKIEQDSNEVEALASALLRLSQEPMAREAYGGAARRYVEREFSFERVARQYESFIRECLEAVAGSPRGAHAA